MKWPRAAHQLRAHCTAGAERTVANTSATTGSEAASLCPQTSKTTHADPDWLEQDSSRPLLWFPAPLWEHLVSSSTGLICLPGKEETEAVPREKKRNSPDRSLNFEQMEGDYIQKRINYLSLLNLSFYPISTQESQLKIKISYRKISKILYSHHELHHMILLLPVLTFLNK